MTCATAILIQSETIGAILFSQSAVHQQLTCGWAYCDICWFFTHWAALSRHLHWVQTALPTSGGHAMWLTIDALAERTVVFPPAVSMCSNLTISVAARWVMHWIHWILADWTALPFGHVVAVTVQLPALRREADGDPALAAAKPAGVHPEHVAVVVLHAVKDAGWLGLIDAFKDVAALARCPVSTRNYSGDGSHLAHRKTA